MTDNYDKPEVDGNEEEPKKPGRRLLERFEKISCRKDFVPFGRRNRY